MEFMNPQKRPVYNRNSGLSLIQQNDGRELLLEKMRGKLAGSAMPSFQAVERKRVARQKTAFDWGWKIAIAAAIGLVNVAWMSSEPEAQVKAAVKHARKLSAPAASLDRNLQALYWACALYDYGQLKSRFGVADGVIINAKLAKERLEAMLPEIDPGTQTLIKGMMPPAGKDK
jgi:hypothetical protein